MLLAVLVGMSLGALGSGGSIITIPVLVYVAGVPPADAVGMSLAIVGATSLVGAILHSQRGNVAYKPALIFAATGMVGAFIGSSGTHLVSRRALMLLFAAILTIVGIRMWRSVSAEERSGDFSVLRCLGVGFAVGLLTGFLGIGGGFLIVPALVLFAGLESRIAAGTSLAVIALNATTGILGQMRFATVDWPLLTGFLSFALVGMIAGTLITGRLPERRLRRMFAATVLVIAAAVGVGNLFFAS
jgi:uncharacterized membrane protein YfcA